MRSPLERIEQLEEYNQQLVRLEDVRLLRLRRAREDLVREMQQRQEVMVPEGENSRLHPCLQASLLSNQTFSEVAPDACSFSTWQVDKGTMLGLSPSVQSMAAARCELEQVSATLDKRAQKEKLALQDAQIQERLRRVDRHSSQVAQEAAVVAGSCLREAAEARLEALSGMELQAAQSARELQESLTLTARSREAALKAEFRLQESDAVRLERAENTESRSSAHQRKLHGSTTQVAVQSKEVHATGLSQRDQCGPRQADNFEEQFKLWRTSIQTRTREQLAQQVQSASAGVVLRADASRSFLSSEQRALLSSNSELAEAVRARAQLASQRVQERARQKVLQARKACRDELLEAQEEKDMLEVATSEAAAEASKAEATMALAAEAASDLESGWAQKMKNAEESLQFVKHEEQLELTSLCNSAQERVSNNERAMEQLLSRQLEIVASAQKNAEERLSEREYHSITSNNRLSHKRRQEELEAIELANNEAILHLRATSEREESIRRQSAERVLELYKESERLQEETAALANLSSLQNVPRPSPAEDDRCQVADASMNHGDLSRGRAGEEFTVGSQDSLVSIIAREGAMTHDFAKNPLSTAGSLALLERSSNDSQDGCMPLVYTAALEGVERHGWLSVYPPEDPPAWTVLHWAAMEGRADICRRLLAATADPCCQDERGWTPLVCAEEAGETEVSSLLMTHYLKDQTARDSLAKTDGAVGKQDAKSLPIILEAAVAAVENYGWQRVHGGQDEWTALHWAAAEGHSSICKRLLLHDADPAQLDNEGKSALEYAEHAGHMDTWQLLHDALRAQDVGKSSEGVNSNHGEVYQGPAAYPRSLLMPPRVSQG